MAEPIISVEKLFFTYEDHTEALRDVTLDIQPRGYDFSIIALTTFGFGMSIGVILFIGLTMMRAMSHEEDEDWVDAGFNGGERTDVHV